MLKKSAAITTAAFVFIAAHASAEGAHPEWELPRACADVKARFETQVEGALYLECLWYGRGIADVLMMWELTAPISVPACIPAHISSATLLSVVQDYMRSNPKAREWEVALTFMRAYAQQWPCAKRR